MRNLVALLFASYISIDQFAAATSQAAVTNQTAAVKHANKQDVQVKDQSDSDSDDDKANVEEASESGSESDDDDEKEEDSQKSEKKEETPTPSKETKVQAEKPVQALAQSRDQYGRDNSGKYLDQKSYLDKRNSLNQKEQSHQTMYDSVMEKLEDPNYTSNALQTASTVDTQVW